jgi:hypothetical protein
MSATQHLFPDVSQTPSIQRDEITATIGKSWDELFGMDRDERRIFQFAAAKRRFDEQVPQLKALKSQVDRLGITGIAAIEDLVPLLFHDSVYKSYPVSLIEKNRFDLLTRWLVGYTTLDLSAVDVRGCERVDDWLAALDEQTQLRIIHTSGTTGKLSFFPRSTLELEVWFESFTKSHEGFGSEAGVKLGGEGGVRLPVIFPTARYGRYVAQRNLRFLESRVAPAPEQLYTLNLGTLSADLVSLSGRIRVAQAKGELAQMTLPQPLRLAMRQYLEDVERRPQESADFFQRITMELRGKRVFVSATSNILYQAASAGLERGMKNVFAADSVGMSGGGGKGIDLPGNWLDVVREFTGISRWKMTYGMSELVGVMPMCDEGHYHVPPFYISFLLDPESGAVLPSEGTKTGRYAFFDLLAQTNWGGIVTGDKLTIDWDAKCPCGRKGPRIHSDIARYSAEVTGEDKVTCAATVDNTDAALQQLLAV